MDEETRDDLTQVRRSVRVAIDNAEQEEGGEADGR